MTMNLPAISNVHIHNYLKNAFKGRQPREDESLFMCLGIHGELGEVVEIIKKAMARGQAQLSRDEMNRLYEEAGDALWYAAVANDHDPTSFWRQCDVGTTLTYYPSHLALNKNLMWRLVVALRTDSLSARVFAVINALQLNPLGVMEMNTAKLQRRYPNGFSVEAMDARADKVPAPIDFGSNGG